MHHGGKTEATRRCKQRESRTPETPLDGLLSRTDPDAHGYLAEALLAAERVDPEGPAPPPAEVAVIDDDAMEAG